MDKKLPERSYAKNAVRFPGDPGLRGYRAFWVAHAMQIEIPDAADVRPLRQRSATRRQKGDETD